MAVTRALIVDDEPLARARLRRLIDESGFEVEVIGEGSNGEEAIELVEDLHPDLLFLDIQMPGLDGFDVVELLGKPRPYIVFATAFDHYALRAFEVHALDYLTKPVRLGRLKDTLARVAHDASAAHGRDSAHDAGINALLAERPRHPLARLTLRIGKKLRVVNLADVRWFEARDKLVYVHVAGAEHPIDFTLDELESRLDAGFVRIHRSVIVNASLVRELLPWFAGSYVLKLEDGTQLPVARRRVSDVKEMLGSGGRVL